MTKEWTNEELAKAIQAVAQSGAERDMATLELVNQITIKLVTMQRRIKELETKVQELENNSGTFLKKM